MNSRRFTKPLRLAFPRSTSQLSLIHILTEVCERRNYILRKSSNLSRQSQIIAANLDQALLVVTIILPKTHVEFIDRFLATAEAYSIPTVIVFNKTDLYGPEDTENMEELIRMYTDIGYKCLSCLLYTSPGLNPAIRAVTIRANREGYKVIGLRRGWAGITEIIRDNKADNSSCYQVLTDDIVDVYKRQSLPASGESKVIAMGYDIMIKPASLALKPLRYCR